MERERKGFGSRLSDRVKEQFAEDYALRQARRRWASTPTPQACRAEAFDGAGSHSMPASEGRGD
jgi:hypothetical protein